MDDLFLSCDWGTTNFRLRLARRSDGMALHEVESDQGVNGLAKAWKEKNDSDEAARQRFYTEVLRDAVDRLRAQGCDVPEGLPVVISGMATSTLGLVELPYARIPAALDGSGFETRRLEATPEFLHPVLLISGLRSDDDVMRGEETQLIGCLTPEMAAFDGEQLLIHPGTHSKHLFLNGGRLVAFQTFMTGELFKLWSTHGILRDNVVASPFDAAAHAPFEQGVAASQEHPLLHGAFLVRTNDLFRRWRKEENYHYLSGLLIGTELQALRAHASMPMYLGAGPALHPPYAHALHALGLDGQVAVLPPEWEEGAVVRGQARVLEQAGGF